MIPAAKTPDRSTAAPVIARRPLAAVAIQVACSVIASAVKQSRRSTSRSCGPFHPEGPAAGRCGTRNDAEPSKLMAIGMTPVDGDLPEGELEPLPVRYKRLLEDRSHFQLILRLTELLNPLPGLESMLRSMLSNIVECIGGTNVKVYYWIGEELHYLDFLGEKKCLPAVDDPDVAQAAETHLSVEKWGKPEEGLMLDASPEASWNLSFPLLVGQELIGAVKLENMHIRASSLGKYLPIFFSHVALILSNEIRNLVRRRAEKALAESETMYRSLVAAMAEGIVFQAADGTVTAVNPAVERIAGYTAAQMIGTDPHWDAIREDGTPFPRALHPSMVTLRTGEPQSNAVMAIRRPDGTLVWLSINSQPLISAGETKPYAVVTTFHDITERRRAEEELRRSKDQLEETVEHRTAELLLARDAAEAANKAKSVFLANMSHELRTPLNAILGFSSMLRHELDLNEGQREKLDIINRSGEHLLTLINNVLEIAKIEAGRVQLDIAPFDIGLMVRDVADMMQLRAQEKGLSLCVDQASAFPRYINGDEARLREVLLNLVGNAVKFTKLGGIVIRLGVKDNGRRHLVMEVEDTGPGIGPEDQKRLFKPFVQLGEKGTQKGTGLGLAISHQFVELMGGTIGVTSQVGKGSVFRVEVPAEEVAGAGIAALEGAAPAREVTGLAPGQPAYRILIAEDQRENQMLLSQVMARIGLEAKIAENGQECVKLFLEWHPHLIWMDRRMPVMDGMEATRAIRELPGGKDVKIVAVTASVFKEQQQEMLDAGMDDFVRKPYRAAEIYDCLAKQLGVQYGYEAAAVTAEAAPAVAIAEKLAALPPPARKELAEALESLDGERIAAVISQIGQADAELGSLLQRMTADFDYPAILNALPSEVRAAEAAGEHTGNVGAHSGT